MDKFETLIKYFALANNEKLQQLPLCPPGCYFHIYQTSIQTSKSLFCLIYELWNLLDSTRSSLAKTEKQDQLLRELWALLSVMIEVQDLPQHFWDINRGYYGFSDDLWDILIRYCTITIKEFRFKRANAPLCFEKLFTVGNNRKGLKKMKNLRVVPAISGFQ